MRPNEVVWWVDIQGRGLHRTSLDGRDRRIRGGATARLRGAAGIGRPGGRHARGIRGHRSDDGSLTLLAPVEADEPDTRMNDGKVDPAGRFWAGTMLDAEGPGGGALYRLDADLSVTEMLRPVSIANGLDWTDDGREMLYIDTTTRRVDRIEYDSATGALGRRRPWVTIPEGAGHPDGMTLDDEGCAWVALWGALVRGALLARWHPDVAHRCAGLEHQQLRLRRSGHEPAARSPRPSGRTWLPQHRVPAGCTSPDLVSAVVPPTAFAG